MQKFEVNFFKKEDGSCPTKEFLDSLDRKMRAKMLKSLELLEVYGNQLREPYSKSLEDGIFEVRAKQGTDITRILYFFVVGQQIILTKDCANFVSQCLYAGSFAPMGQYVWYHRFSLFHNQRRAICCHWGTVYGLHSFLTSSAMRNKIKGTITITSSNLVSTIRKGIIQPGDVVFFSYYGGSFGHTALIGLIDYANTDIFYYAHTDPRDARKKTHGFKLFFSNFKSGKLKIIRIR